MASGPTAHPWRFRLVQDTTINAFALPGGFVYVNTALVRSARNVDELAGVLGHEVAHARLRHGAKQQDKATATTLVVSLFCGLTSWCNNAVTEAVLRVGAGAAFAKFSRTDELQADSAGLLYAARAGYDPRGVIRFFETLQAKGGSGLPAALTFLSSHPMEETRIARATALLPAAPPVEPAPANVREAFAALKAAVAPGRTLVTTTPTPARSTTNARTDRPAEDSATAVPSPAARGGAPSPAQTP